LETVQHEATRIEIIQEAAQISTRVDEPDKIHELIQSAQAHEVLSFTFASINSFSLQ
jgi:hypothetical protein